MESNTDYGRMQSILQTVALSHTIEEPLGVEIDFKRRRDKSTGVIKADFDIKVGDYTYSNSGYYCSEEHFRSDFITEVIGHLEEMIGGSFEIKFQGAKSQKQRYHLTISTTSEFNDDLRKFREACEAVRSGRGGDDSFFDVIPFVLEDIIDTQGFKP